MKNFSLKPLVTREECARARAFVSTTSVSKSRVSFASSRKHVLISAHEGAMPAAPSLGVRRARFVVRWAALLAYALLVRVERAHSQASADARLATEASWPLWLDPGPGGARAVSAALEGLLRRTGPNMRASADYRDFLDVRLDESLEAWRATRAATQRWAERQVRALGPRLVGALGEANVSAACARAASRTLAAIARLDSWAVQMHSSSGSFPPRGLLDGQFTDLGHYRGCVDIKLQAANNVSEAPNRIAAGPRHPASYCVLGFRPIVPARKRFHLIFEEEPRPLLELFNSSDLFAALAHKAQYFHYVYLKTGVCAPSECSARDLQRVAALVGRRLALTPAPVKCFTRANNHVAHDSPGDAVDDLEELENSRPVTVELGAAANTRQLVALALICGFFSLVALASLWHALDIVWQSVGAASGALGALDDFDSSDEDTHNECSRCPFDANNNHQLARSAKFNQSGAPSEKRAPVGAGAASFKTATFHYLSLVTNGREFLDTSMRPGEIRCLHGFRVFSMLWIISVHTLQYNEWSGFTRIFENVASFQNVLVHPLINANYVVDNFFLMSGLLAAYSTWHSTKGSPSNFSLLQSLLGRYLRLTPQVLLISLMYIVLPMLGQKGPFWYDMTHYTGKYCEKNWWVNLLHVQAFYRKDEMCNLVGWWISVDMFYYALALALLWLVLSKRVGLALSLTSLYVIYCTIATAWHHYTNGFSPNNLGLIPQVQEVWRDFVVEFYWSPGPHAFVFFFGFWLGYALANKLGVRRVRRWSRFGWSLSLATLLAINLSSRLWIMGSLELSQENQYISTSYNIVCVIGWACSFGWMIVACHYGCAPALNRALSTNISVMLSKASFIIYLSHMLILRTFFGSQYNLLEVSMSTVGLLIMGLIIWSTLFGIFLCVAFEGPCLKFQRLVLQTIKERSKRSSSSSASHHNHQVELDSTDGSGVSEHKDPMRMGPTSVALLK